MGEGFGRAALVVVLGAALVAGLIVVVHHTKSCPETCYWGSGRFVPAHTDYWTTMQCAMTDKDGNCSFYMPVTHSNFVPDKWYGTFTDCLGAAHEVEIDQTMFSNKPRTVAHSHLRWRTCKCNAEW